MSSMDFKQRLRQAEMSVKPGLFEEVLAARARKRNMRFWFAGTLVSVLFIIGVVLFRQADAGGKIQLMNQHPGAEGQIQVAEQRKTTMESSAGGAVAAVPQGEPQSRQMEPDQRFHPVKPKKQRFGYAEFKAETARQAEQSESDAAGGWTVYPPLSALDKSMSVSAFEQPEALGRQLFGLLPARNRKPEGASKSDYNSGLRPVHNDWLIEVLADPARMQVYAASTSYNKLLNRTEHQQTAMQAVIRAGKQLGTNFRWFAGLKWSEQRSHFDYIHAVAQSATVVDEHQVTIREPGFPDRQLTVHDTSVLNTQVHAAYAATNRMRMMGIPLGVQFAPAGKSGSIYVFGSLMPAFLLKTRGMRVLPDGTVAYMESAGYMRRFQLNTELGLGMRKTLAQGLFLTLEPRLSYGLLNLNHTAVRQKGIQMGMSVGLSFRPGR